MMFLSLFSSSCLCCLSQGNIEEKVLTRIACNSLLRQKIARWRNEHKDWEALAAFALSKNTGRRFKKKLHGDSHFGLDSNVSGENAFSSNTVSKKTATQSVNDTQISDSDSVTLGDECTNTASDKPHSNKLQNVSDRSVQMTECSLKQKPSIGSSPSVCSDVVVKQISLDDLSDEELFLPPPDEDASDPFQKSLSSSRTKIAKGFFVDSSDDEGSFDGEYPASEATKQTAASSDIDDDDNTVSSSVLRSSIKSSTMFANSLSHRQRDYAIKTAREDKRSKNSVQQQKLNTKKHYDGTNKRFSDRQFARSAGSFPNAHGSRYPKKNKSFQGKTSVNTKYVDTI